MREDPLAGLLSLVGVADAVTRARSAVDAAYARIRQPERVADAVRLQAAAASAALEGHQHEPAEAMPGAIRCVEALPGLVDRWRQAPRQVLARLHLLAARGMVDEADLGRPAGGPAVAARLDQLLDRVLRDAAPGLLRVAVVHGELLALRPFPGPYGVVARAAARLELMAGGLDPRGLIAVEAGHLAREPEYVGSAGAFATGTRDGVRAWLRHCAAAVEHAAAAVADAAAPAQH